MEKLIKTLTSAKAVSRTVIFAIFAIISLIGVKLGFLPVGFGPEELSASAIELIDGLIAVFTALGPFYTMMVNKMRPDAEG